MEVLIGDSSEFMCRLLREVMSDGCEIVADVSSGLELVDEYAAHDPDCVILDVDLTIVDGIEATNRITEHDPDAHVVVCTTNTDDGTRTAAREAGAAEYVVKPFRKAELERALPRD